MALEILTKEENLLKNLAIVKSKSDNKKVYAFLNANAYGHGIIKVGRLIDDEVEGFWVVNESELRLLKENGIKKPIFLIGQNAQIEKDGFETKKIPLDLNENLKRKGCLVEDYFKGFSLNLYGYPKGEFFPVMEVYSEVLDIFKIPPHANVGYCKVGRFGATIATVKGGFADGFSSDFIGSHLLIKGKPYPIVAVFTHSCLLKVDENVNEKDKVCICGSSEGRFRYFDELAREIKLDLRELLIRFGNLERNGKN